MLLLLVDLELVNVESEAMAVAFHLVAKLQIALTDLTSD
jgi:hypothetical protein